MKYPEYKSVNYAEIADEILAFWKANNIFEKSIEVREGSPAFTFYEGPPSANGIPGIHHVMARTIKDIFCRYKTLRGFQVNRKAGWDTHGLPVELQVEKELGITKEDIGKKISVEEYNRKCREAVMRFTGIWRDMTDKMGYWVDMDDPYITYESAYIESVWSLLKKLHDKGLLYKGYTIQPYSPAAGTGLSSHELNQPGTYKDVKDTSLTAQFKVVKNERSQFLFDTAGDENVYFLAWTTTPWTLPSNAALTVGKNIEYSLVKTFNPYTFLPINAILATDLIAKYFNEKGQNGDFLAFESSDKKMLPWTVLQTWKGADLEGIEYEQLMPYVQPKSAAFRVIIGDFVTTEDGTGIVHTAPTFGADDYRVAVQNGIPAIMVEDENGKDAPLVDRKGRFVKEVTDFALEYVKEAYYTTVELEAEKQKQGRDKYLSVDERIAIQLKTENKAFHVQRYEHSYPHCWRTDKPVLYYPMDSWFIRTTAAKDKLAQLNKTINWQPESTGSGRFGNWLENLVDWNLSRSRYWGTPLPIWRHCIPLYSESGQNPSLADKVIGSLADLREPGWYYLSERKFEELQDFIYNFIHKATTLDEIEWANKGDIPSNFNQTVEEVNKSQPNVDKLNSLSDAFKRWGNVNYQLNYLSQVVLESTNDYFINFLIDDYFSHCSTYLDSGDIDLHRPIVDRIFYVENIFEQDKSLNTLPNLNSQFKKLVLYNRETDLIDVWFDSGAMPYAQWHYPFENQEIFDKAFPADFISEGVDQTRGWFFTLHAIAGMLFDSVAFKNVVSTGLVLDKNGNKMSKRLGNAVDPFDTLSKYGADPTRWYMITNAEPWDNLRFNLDGVQEVQRKLFGTLTNTYNFFALYANLDGYTIEQFNRVPREKLTQLDRWIVSRIFTLVKEVTEEFDNYNPTKAGRLIQDFVNDDLSNWYVRLNRRRFWQGEMTEDKRAAYQTLQHALCAVGQLMSPIAPFYAEWLYKNLTDGVRGESVAKNTPFKHESVHFTTWHTYEPDWVDADLEEAMALAQKICSMVHALRKKSGLKVRQPLQKILIPALNPRIKAEIESVAHIILSEVNIKEIEFITDDSGILKKKVKPNFKTLGPKFGKDMKAVAEAITGMSPAELKTLESAGSIAVSGYEIALADVEILTEDIPGWLLAAEGGLTVALDIHVSEDLKQEGIARDFVNRIQNLRKDSGFEVTDKIHIWLQETDEGISRAVEKHAPYICAEVQALKLEILATVEGARAVDFDEHEILVKIEVA